VDGKSGVLEERLGQWLDVNWIQDVGWQAQARKFKITSHYHKSGDFQDNTANREFFGLT
jgi:hypothetical protein